MYFSDLPFSLFQVVPVPLRRITMKGLMQYPIKLIDQLSHTDLVIVSKYENKTRKDKIKTVHAVQSQIKWTA